MEFKLDKTFIFIKNYAVIFISNAYVCNYFTESSFVHKKGYLKNWCFHTTVEVYGQMKSNFTATPMIILNQLTNASVKEILQMTTQW